MAVTLPVLASSCRRCVRPRIRFKLQMFFSCVT
uniref:Uncharacterized protein n=1 Tax=Anguilla anguilla TaxID=7936 RepID=A0A0E9SUB7_ANGAN